MIKNIFKKAALLPISLGLFTVSLIILLLGCRSYDGFPEMSDSLEDAIKKKVFIAEYAVPNNPYMINDTLGLNVKESWVEYHWKYNKKGYLTYYPGYQLIIICNQDMPNTIFSWTIGTTDGPNFRQCAKDCFMADFNELPKSTEKWIVQKGMLINNKKPEIIGKFELIRIN